jgi:hypothetical protein
MKYESAEVAQVAFSEIMNKFKAEFQVHAGGAVEASVGGTLAISSGKTAKRKSAAPKSGCPVKRLMLNPGEAIVVDLTEEFLSEYTLPVSHLKRKSTEDSVVEITGKFNLGYVRPVNNVIDLTEEVNVGYMRPLKRLKGNSAEGSVVEIEENPNVG